MPGGAAARVFGLIDDTANLIEGLDVLSVLSEGEFDSACLMTASMRRSRFGSVSGSASRRRSASLK